MYCECRVCGMTFKYDHEVGYDRELCGPFCDGREAERRRLAPIIDALLVSCKSVAEEITLYRNDEGAVVFTGCDALLEKLNAAIAKATGGNP
jgi:hypothetical protein